MNLSSPYFQARPLRPHIAVCGEAATVRKGTLRVIAACLAVLLGFFLPGCSSSEANAVNQPQARDALKTALDAWKAGQTPDTLSSGAMPMTVQDFDWKGGARLIEYQVVDDGQPAGANLKVQVKLIMAGKTAGKNVERKVWYLVGTSPSVTVFRDMLRK